MKTAGSVFEALSPAAQHTRAILFRPFDPGRWIILGFLTFLQILGEGGGYNGFRIPSGSSWKEREQSFHDAATWIAENLALVAIVGFFVVLVVLALIVLFWWLSARGTFCYLDCVATNRAAVVRPWREQRALADSYFFWRLVFTLVVVFTLALLTVPAAVSLWSLFEAEGSGRFWRSFIGPAFVAALVLAAVLVIIAAAVIKTFLVDFVAPVQYMRRVPCSEAIRIVLGLVRESPGAFVVYIIVRVLIAIGAAMALFLLGCLTCCVGFCCLMIPVLGQTVLQPLYVFIRALPLFFLRGFGPGFDAFPAEVLSGGPAGWAPPAGPAGSAPPGGPEGSAPAGGEAPLAGSGSPPQLTGGAALSRPTGEGGGFPSAGDTTPAAPAGEGSEPPSPGEAPPFATGTPAGGPDLPPKED